MKRMKTVLVLLVICGVAACQSYIDFRKPMRLLYGGDTLIISLQGDSVIFSGEAAELVLRDSTLLEIIQAHGGTGGRGVVDTTGGQDINKIAVWSDKTTLDGPDDFTYQTGNMKIIIGETDRVSLYPTVADGAESIAYLFSSNTNLTNATSKIFQFDNQSSNKFYQIGSGRIFNENGGFQAGLGTTNFSDITSSGFRTILNSAYLLNLNPGVTSTGSSVAYLFDTHNNLTGVGSRLMSVKNQGVEKFFVSTNETGVNNYLVANDSIFAKYLGSVGSSGDTWLTLTNTNALDTAHTEPAYIGWEMKDLPTLEEYEADVKMINGHMERRIWYIDYETKELKSQYGWSGLGMMNTQSAYMIYHEITVRWMFEQNRRARMQQMQIAGLVLLLIFAYCSRLYEPQVT